MNRETFLDSFGHVADSPGGIDKLRGLIRAMAVRGSLVHQNPLDEPASEFLKRVAGERAELVNTGRTRRSRPQQPVVGSEVPYPAPPGWEWTRIGTIFGMQAGSNVPAGTIQDSGLYPCYGGNGVRGYVESFNRDGSYPIIGRQGALCGNVKVANGRFYATEHAVVVDCFAGTSVAWAALALDALNLNQYATATAQPGLSVERISGVLVAVPPLEEQLRIVERVEVLMALCDELEQQRAARVGARTALTGATLHRVTQAETADEMRDAINSFADRIDLYFAPGDGDLAALQRLRQTILALAIRGRLTHRDVADEPASELVARISRERDRSAPAKRSRTAGRSAALPSSSRAFEIPETWGWTRVGDVCQSRLGKMLDGEKNTGTPRPYLRNTNVQWGRFKLDDVKQIRLEDEDLAEYSLQDGDLLVVEGGEPGRCAIWDSGFADGVMVFQKALHRVRPEGGISARFLAMVLRNGIDSGRLRKLFTGSTIKHLTGERLKGFMMPLPPVAEQHRIVDRVEELFAFCDDLEQQLLAAQVLRSDLAASIAAHITSTAPEDAA